MGQDTWLPFSCNEEEWICAAHMWEALMETYSYRNQHVTVCTEELVSPKFAPWIIRNWWKKLQQQRQWHSEVLSKISVRISTHLSSWIFPSHIKSVWRGKKKEKDCLSLIVFPWNQMWFHWKLEFGICYKNRTVKLLFLCCWIYTTAVRDNLVILTH